MVLRPTRPPPDQAVSSTRVPDSDSPTRQRNAIRTRPNRPGVQPGRARVVPAPFDTRLGNVLQRPETRVRGEEKGRGSGPIHAQDYAIDDGRGGRYSIRIRVGFGGGDVYES